MSEQRPEVISLTPKGLAICHFAFRDGPALGMSDKIAYETANELIEEWDGTETLLQIYQRRYSWPLEIDK